MLKHHPKTLAKTLDFIIRHSPGEHGLFWDPDGTMPWKEFYWVLQEDPSLRFVREATIRELVLLGVELPFVLDGNLLRLRAEFGPPVYSPVSEVPKRLYFGIKPNKLVHSQHYGLNSTRRPFIALSSQRDLALQIAGRNEKAPVLVEILAREACESGMSFLEVGGDLYLVESVPVEFILFPMVRADLVERLSPPGRKPKASPSPSMTPGSFIVQPRHLEAPGAGKPPPGRGVREGTKGGWKKHGRKDRHKRDS